jgi:hypothetical protein
MTWLFCPSKTSAFLKMLEILCVLVAEAPVPFKKELQAT